ncbi:MAG TPA: hypothetical protein VN047_05160 [Sphingopyxis sp.]|nr:hypothetical protein [Sphingopyxis sp.]
MAAFAFREAGNRQAARHPAPAFQLHLAREPALPLDLADHGQAAFNSDLK